MPSLSELSAYQEYRNMFETSLRKFLKVKNLFKDRSIEFNSQKCCSGDCKTPPFPKNVDPSFTCFCI